MRTALLLPLATLCLDAPVHAPDAPPWSEWSDGLGSLDSFRLVYSVRPEDPERAKMLTLCYEAPDRLVCSMGDSVEEALPFGLLDGSRVTIATDAPEEQEYGTVDTSDALERAADWLDSTRRILGDDAVEGYELQHAMQLGIRYDTESEQLDISPNLSFVVEAGRQPFTWIPRLEAVADGADSTGEDWEIEADDAVYTLSGASGLIERILVDGETAPILVLESAELDVELDEGLFEVDGHVEEMGEDGGGGLALLPFFVARTVGLRHLLDAIDDGLEPEDRDWEAWVELFADYYTESGAPDRAEPLYEPLCESIDEWIESIRDQIDEHGDDPEFRRELAAVMAQAPREFARRAAIALGGLVRSQYLPPGIEDWSEETRQRAFSIEIAAVSRACGETLLQPVLEYLADQLDTLRG